MNELQKKELQLAITRLTTKIDTYERAAQRTKKKAIYEDECGYRETAQFNKGQQFALEYVIEDLQIILHGLENIK